MSELIKVADLPEHTFNKFFGGAERGLSLQITISGEHDEYIQLSSAQVRELLKALQAEWGTPIEEEVVKAIMARLIATWGPAIEYQIRAFLFPTPPLPVMWGQPVGGEVEKGETGTGGA